MGSIPPCGSGEKHNRWCIRLWSGRQWVRVPPPQQRPVTADQPVASRRYPRLARYTASKAARGPLWSVRVRSSLPPPTAPARRPHTTGQNVPGPPVPSSPPRVGRSNPVPSSNGSGLGVLNAAIGVRFPVGPRSCSSEGRAHPSYGCGPRIDTGHDHSRGGEEASRRFHVSEIAGASPARATSPPPRDKGIIPRSPNW